MATRRATCRAGLGLVSGAWMLALVGCEKPSIPTPELSAGRNVYRLRCVSCHGSEGRGVPGTFPALRGSAIIAGDPDVLARVVREGPRAVLGDRGNPAVMPPVPDLPERDLLLLVNYLRQTFAGQPPVESLAHSPAAPAP